MAQIKCCLGQRFIITQPHPLCCNLSCLNKKLLLLLIINYYYKLLFVQTTSSVLLYNIFLPNKVVYLVAFGDKTWNNMVRKTLLLWIVSF